MLHLQLFIEGQEVELHQNESIVLTQTLQDILDVQKVFTDYSRTFNVPASKNNNKIFKHYYNPAVVNTNTQVSREAVLHLNYQPFKVGRIKNESVQMKNGEPSNYRITFLGNTIQFKEILQDASLQDLSELDTSLLYDAPTVLSTMQDGQDFEIDANVLEDAFIYPLISSKNRLVYDNTDSTAGTYNLYASGSNHGVVFDQLKPAVRIHAIILAIEKQFGISFSRDFFNSTNLPYYNIYLWLHKQKGGVDPNENDISTNNLALNALAGDWYDKVGTSTNLREGFGTGGYYDNIDANRKRYMSISVNAPAGVKFSIKVTEYFKVLHDSEYEGTGDFQSTAVDLEMLQSYTTGGQDRDRRFYISVQSNSNSTITLHVNVFDGDSNANAKIDYTSSTSLRTTVKDEMPKMKLIDFVTSLFKLFNLTAFFDGEQIQVLPLDDYYAGSDNTYDITKYLDNSQSKVQIAYPFKEISFKYQGLDSFFSKFHSTYFNQEWGSVLYSNNADFTSDTYDISVPFEHHKFERFLGTTAQWGWSADDKQEPYLGKPLLFYAHKVTDGTPIQFSETVGGTTHQIDDYYIPANNVDPTDNDSQSLHFGGQKNEYTGVYSENSLFYTYYKNYIEEVFDISRRLFTFKAFLPVSIISNIKLNDKVVIFDNAYKINKLTTNFETGISDLELINVTQDLEYDPAEVQEDLIVTIDTGLVTADTTTKTADATIIIF